MPIVACYGDSIVTGRRGASSPDRRWAARVCAELGSSERTHAVDGLGFVRSRGPGRTHTGEPLGVLADVLASDADACVVALGVNDSVIVAERHDEVAAAITRDLDLLVQRFGTGRLAVLDLYAPWADTRPPGWRTVRGLLDAAARTHGRTLLPGLADAVRADPALLCADGVHPNDAGHAALATAVLPRLRDVLAPPTSCGRGQVAPGPTTPPELIAAPASGSAAGRTARTAGDPGTPSSG